jgi:bifunctional enzyme CysN/CysC
MAAAGDAVTITLQDELDIARGDVIVGTIDLPEVSDQFAAHVIWMGEDPMIPGRSFLARIGTKTLPISITALKYKIDVNTNERLAAHTIGLNDIAYCNFSTATPVTFDPYEKNHRTGSFILIDRFTNQTVGAGMIAFGLRRGANIQWQSLLISKAERATIKHQRPAVLWFTGLSGAGKSTVANLVEQRLHLSGFHTMMLDGDNVRHGLCRDLGFTEADRVENIRRVGEVAKLMVESGLIVLCSFISPYSSDREMVRSSLEPDEFIEVFVDTPLAECIRRDPKGLYAKAQAGNLKNFTGLDAPYERPSHPEVHLCTVQFSPVKMADEILIYLLKRQIITSLDDI